MVHQCQHQDAIKSAAGAIQKRLVLSIAPTNTGTWPGEIYDQREDIQLLFRRLTPKFADDHWVLINRYYTRAGSRGNQAKVSRVAANIQQSLWFEL